MLASSCLLDLPNCLSRHSRGARESSVPSRGGALVLDETLFVFCGRRVETKAAKLTKGKTTSETKRIFKHKHGHRLCSQTFKHKL